MVAGNLCPSGKNKADIQEPPRPVQTPQPPPEAQPDQSTPSPPPQRVGDVPTYEEWEANQHPYVDADRPYPYVEPRGDRSSGASMAPNPSGHSGSIGAASVLTGSSAVYSSNASPATNLDPTSTAPDSEPQGRNYKTYEAFFADWNEWNIRNARLRLQESSSSNESSSISFGSSS
ncbi:hypothetical protein BJ508DRAFT_314538 [Ascobolus immersus RN42]|uniref:Uncharacterized protein n=1 Tax=Ascobolus immersus RN42 TaxID=1160509 RepID=A0A3N4HEN1_ASCIM|nr:hypothetical protein BJ508DRAFT_314538 [Ascobolus immersus RN42]